MSQRFVRTIATSDLPENSSKAVQLEGKYILLCNSGGEFFAMDNKCSHAESVLEGGRIRNKFISCPLHGMRFNLRDGSAHGQLTRRPVPVYPVQIVDGFIEVGLP